MDVLMIDRPRLCLIIASLLLWQATFAVAEDPLQDTEAQDSPAASLLDEERSVFARFPEPFEYLKTNIHEIEESGYFEILATRYDILRDDRKERGIIWTLRAKKNMTYRHVKRLLNRFRDVRFYLEKQRDNGLTQIEAHSTLLFYPIYIDAGIAESQRLLQGTRMEIWIDLNSSEIRRILAKEVTRVVFQHPAAR